VPEKNFSSQRHKHVSDLQNFQKALPAGNHVFVLEEEGQYSINGK